MSKTTMRSSALKVREVLASYGDKKVRGKIVQADALTFLKSLTSESADLVFLDPPFNLGKLYSSRNRDIDRKPEEEYSRWLEKIVSESGRVLVPGGALYLYHLPKWAMLLGSVLVGKSGLKFLHWIAISMKNGFVGANGFIRPTTHCCCSPRVDRRSSIDQRSSRQNVGTVIASSRTTADIAQ